MKYLNPVMGGTDQDGEPNPPKDPPPPGNN